MALPDDLTPYGILRGTEATLAVVTKHLTDLADSQPDTALEGMLLTAVAAVIGARASLADVRLAWDEHCQPEDKTPGATLLEALQQAEEARLAALKQTRGLYDDLSKTMTTIEGAIVEIEAGNEDEAVDMLRGTLAKTEPSFDGGTA